MYNQNTTAPEDLDHEILDESDAIVEDVLTTDDALPWDSNFDRLIVWTPKYLRRKQSLNDKVINLYTCLN